MNKLSLANARFYFSFTYFTSKVYLRFADKNLKAV